MADGYAVTGEIAAVTASPGDSPLSIDSVTTKRGSINHLVISHGATPDDKVIQWLIRRKTTAGTGTAVVPSKLDPASVASLVLATEKYSVEPTITAASELFDEDVNQRATYTLILAPGKEFIVPATANNGIIVTPISAAYGGIAHVTAYFE